MTKLRDPALGLLVAAALMSGGAPAAEPTVTVYKSPTCGCCDKWVAHLEDNDFAVESVDFIEGFYNTRRRHSAIDYDSRVNYERRFHSLPNPESDNLSTETG
jgi:hypothetical protein